MGVVFTCLIIFAAFIAAAFGGLALHKRLPPEHKSDIARTVVGQVSGLVSLHLALVLGALIGVSFAYFSTQKTGLEAASIAFAIFLIFQLRMPYTGLYKVSLAPLEQAIEFIDR